MRKITENVYQLESTRRSYAYIILGEETILIDTGFLGMGKAILRELNSMNIKPGSINHILLTHHDLDHVANAVLLQKLSGASLWASKEDIPYITGEKSRYGIKRFFSYISRVKKPAAINVFPESLKFKGIEIIETPGHTPGHVCLLYNDVLFIGDLLQNPKGVFKPLPSYLTWDRNALKKSVEKVSELSFKWICPAHGSPVERSAVWDQFVMKYIRADF